MNLIDAEGLTSAPVSVRTYCRSLGISGHLVPPERRLAVLKRLHGEPGHVVVTRDPRYWALAHPRNLVRVLPEGDLPVKDRLTEADVYALWCSGLSKAQARTVLVKKKDSAAKDVAAVFAACWEQIQPDDLQGLELLGESPLVQEQRFEYHLVDTAESFLLLREQLAHARDTGLVVGLDVEGTSEDDRTAELVGLGVTVGRVAFYAPLNGSIPSGAFVGLFTELLPGLKYIAHFSKYDYKMLKRAGLPIDRAELAGDGLLAAYCLADVDELGRPRPKGLKPLVQRYLGVTLMTFDEMLTLSGEKDASTIPLDQIGPYCAADAYYGVVIEQTLRAELERRGPRIDIYERLELPNVLLLAEMELLGLPIDLPLTKQRKLEYLDRTMLQDVTLDHLAKAAGWGRTRTRSCKFHTRKRSFIEGCEDCDENGKVTEFVGFNPGSGPMLRNLMQQHFQLPAVALTPKGQASYDEDALLLLREQAEGLAKEFIELLLTWRGDTKVLSTYLIPFVESAVPADGCQVIRPKFNQTVVESGRLSSSDPNAQNIPLDLRDLFVAPPGYLLWGADYNQLELRVLARLSGCRAMIEAYSRGEDIHALTAWRVFGIPSQSLTPEMRVRSKTLNFGISYEASAEGVFKQLREAALKYPELSLSVPTIKDCQRLVNEYFRAYPEVRSAVEFSHAQTQRKGYSETLYGRRRYLPNINHPAWEVRGKAQRQGWNHQVQGTAGDIMKGGQLVVARYAKEHDADIRCQVHDELWGLVKEERAREWLPVVAKAMVLDQLLRPVMLVVEPSVGRNWKELK